MKTVYLDPVGGISGDMTVAAFIDLGVPVSAIKRELGKLALGGYALTTHRVQRGHLRALRFEVFVKQEKNFSYLEITRLIGRSRLSGSVKARMLKIYETLKDAEERVHGHGHRDLRFHQLGETDSLVDIAAVCVCLEARSVARILYPAIPLGLAVAPAVSVLLEGRRIYFTDAPYENVTPTGMAILRALGEQTSGDQRESFVQGRAGYGAGAADPPGVTNALRAVELGGVVGPPAGDDVIVVEANIDDMNPQMYGDVMERLLRAGALDVFLTNVLMKKTRPGILLTVLSGAVNFDKISDIILRETTTIGLRYYGAGRVILPRSWKRVVVLGQQVRIKTVTLPDGSRRSVPEYEDCRQAARITRRPLQEVVRFAQAKG
ncbi:MAG: LarC family nickel insertion protein [Candidatus Omnitrophica bacterium]|nr:LarC family nickel insertion protein [Candidatus Omnitrophota bacterium]MDD5573961.1 LarC family nickel insertion protein [Candidatus Omnitrophota bacterium]